MTQFICCKTEPTHECDIQTLLHRAGLYRSKDRHNLIELLSRPRTWTIRELHHAAHHTNYSTVYRNIMTFIKKGVIREVGVVDGETHFEWADQKHHDHRICIDCRDIACIPCPVPTLKDHRLELRKPCRSCK